VAAAISMLTGFALLASTPVRWRWDPAPGCPDVASVVEQSEALLDPREPREPVEASGQITGRPGAYALQLQIAVGARVERRQLEASDCELLTHAGVLVVAITIDALATAAARPVERAPGPELPAVELPPAPVEPPPSRPSVAPAATRPDVPAPAPSRASIRASTRASTLYLGLGAGLGWGLSASGTAGFEGIVGGQRGAWRLELAGYHWLSQPASLTADAGTESALSGAWIHACRVWSWRAVDLPLCAGVDLAAVHGRGVGARVEPQEVRDLWIALSAGPGLEFRPIPAFALRARIEPLVALRRPAMFLLVDGRLEQTFRMPNVGLRMVLSNFLRRRPKETARSGAT